MSCDRGTEQIFAPVWSFPCTALCSFNRVVLGTKPAMGPIHPWYFTEHTIFTHPHHHVGITFWLLCSMPQSQRGGQRRAPQGNGRGGRSSQSSGGRGQGKGRGQDRNRTTISAADLDAELDKYHAAAVKEEWGSGVLFTTQLVRRRDSVAFCFRSMKFAILVLVFYARIFFWPMYNRVSAPRFLVFYV
jgi:hypothetical protein